MKQLVLSRDKTTKTVFIMLKPLVVVGIIALLIQNYFLSLKPRSHIVLKDATIGDQPHNATKKPRSHIVLKNAVIGDQPHNATKNAIIYHQNCADIASIQANLTRKTTNITGLIFSHPMSNFPDEVLRTHLGKKPLNWENDPAQFKSIGEEISKAVIEYSTTRSNYTFRTTSGSNFTLLPTFGKYGISSDMRKFSTAIFLQNDQCQFPKKGSMLSNDFRNRFVKEKKKRYLKRILLSGETVHNFYHCTIFVDAMCRYKDDPELNFLIATRFGIPKYVKNFANAFGVSVVDHDRPIVAEEIFTSTSGMRDWTCIRDHFATEGVEQDSILFILRRTGKSDRDIPKSIHDKLVKATSVAIPSLKTVTFDGSETFDETIKKFQRAKIVVGPHGAAMTNLLFSKEGTQVIEYFIPRLIGRYYLFTSATTIGMEWWPVLLSSFQAESEILRSVAVIKEAANRQTNNSIIHHK